jgi:hypothetical protein
MDSAINDPQKMANATHQRCLRLRPRNLNRWGVMRCGGYWAEENRSAIHSRARNSIEGMRQSIHLIFESIPATEPGEHKQ